MAVDKTSDEYKKYLNEFREFYSGWDERRLSHERINIREAIRSKGEIPWLVARRQVCSELMDRLINGRYEGDKRGRGKTISFR